jgi:hypothetical protein
MVVPVAIPLPLVAMALAIVPGHLELAASVEIVAMVAPAIQSRSIILLELFQLSRAQALAPTVVLAGRFKPAQSAAAEELSA